MSVISELENKLTAKRIWSEDEIDTLKRYYSKCSVKDIMPYLNGRTEGTIRVKANELGISKKRNTTLGKVDTTIK